MCSSNNFTDISVNRTELLSEMHKPKYMLAKARLAEKCGSIKKRKMSL